MKKIDSFTVESYRRALVQVASDPETYDMWVAQRPSDRIMRLSPPRFEWRGRGSRRVRKAVAK